MMEKCVKRRKKVKKSVYINNEKNSSPRISMMDIFQRDELNEEEYEREGERETWKRG